MYQNIPTKCLTGECRLSYVHLTQPYASPSTPGAKAKYQVTLLIPKTDVATKADIDAAIQAAYQQGVASKWNGLQPRLASPLIHDGDGTKNNGAPYGDECKGHWVLTASSATIKPQVVHISNISQELAPQDIYSGMYGRVTINFYPFDSGNNKGVGCGLGNVLKTRDGDPLGGGASASSDFAGLEQAVDPTAAQDFTQYAAPQAAPAPAPQYATPQYNTPQAAPAPQYTAPAPQAAPRVNPITGLPM